MKKLLSMILSVAFIASLSSVTVSASETTNVDLENQDLCIESYSDLLDSFAENRIIDFPDDFGGIYYNSEVGKAVLCLTDCRNVDYYQSYFEDGLVDFEIVNYNYDEIYDLYYFISEHMSDLNVTVVGASQTNNCVEVSVQSDGDKSTLIEYVQNNGYNADMIQFEENSMPLLTNQAKMESFSSTQTLLSSEEYNQCCAGSKIYVYSSLASEPWWGTVGANAYNPDTNQYGVVTAGHLASFSNTISVRNNDGVVFNQGTGIIYQFGGKVDAGFIPYTTNNFSPNPMINNIDEVDYIYKTQYITSPAMEGSSIVKYGAATGKQVGTITDLSKTISCIGGVTLSDVIEYSMTCTNGDSGAPIGFENSDGLYLLGLHSAGTGLTGYAVKYNNIEESLGIEFYTMEKMFD